MTKRTKRFLWWCVGLGVVAVMVALGSRPTPVPAEMEPVVRGMLRVTIDEEGETRVRDRFVISAPVAGRVLRIELEPGDPVLAGETVLASFLPSTPVLLDARNRAEAEAAVDAAEAAVGRAEALYEETAARRAFAESEANRFLRLADEGIVSAERAETAKLEFDTIQEALEASEFGVRDAESNLNLARARLLRTGGGTGSGAGAAIEIVSPVDGVVLRRIRESEAVVAPGEALLEVGDPREIEVVTDYLSRDAVRMRAGQAVLVDRWGGDRPLAGRVRRIEPSGFTRISALGVEEQRVNVVMELTGPADSRPGLGDGFRVESQVVVWESEDEVKVPTGALFRRGEAWAAFVVEGGRAVERLVEIGERNQQEAQVLNGLQEGETVIVYPSDILVDGSPVAPTP